MTTPDPFDAFDPDDMDTWPKAISALAARLDVCERELAEHKAKHPRASYARGGDIEPRKLDAKSDMILAFLRTHAGLKFSGSMIADNLDDIDPKNVTNRLDTLVARGLVIKHEREGHIAAWQAAPKVATS